MMKVNTQCRECGSAGLAKFLDLGAQPPANSFLTKAELAQPEAKFPLEAYFCRSCNAAQLVHVVDKSLLFRNYVYFSSGMPKVSPHWQAYAEHVMKNFLPEKNGFVVEIGSNDGILLKFFQDNGYKVLGIDPAENVAKVAEERGVPTWAEFFGNEIARKIAAEHGQAMAIMANNVVAHIDEHQDLVAGIKTLLAPKGVFVLEAPYLIDMFENLTYDTIYHEHLGFLAVRPLQKLFAKYGMDVFDVKVVPSQGQSIRLFACHQGAYPTQQSVRDLVQKEIDFGFDKEESYHKLGARVAASREKLMILLRDLKKQGKIIASYGAPAKGNTLLNYCNIGTDILDYALEDLPNKHDLYSPGMHIPVVSRAYAQAHQPDYYLMLAWNYEKAILEKEQEFLKRGGHFIIPVGDEIRII
ncbi:MAG: class I SAM-dependent methyltransferase [bacterium]|nr:class I SAM-dependent methyltransferase [bacterium]